MPDHVITLQADVRDRLDKFVAARVPELSRSAVQRLIDGGCVTVNGVVTAAARKVGQGDQVVVRIPPPAPAALEPEPIPLNIVYEDADLIVIDKPAGLVVHPAAGHDRGTLVNAVLAHAPDLKGVGGEIRPGIVHRLDKDTSGLIIVAKHAAALRELQRQFKARAVKKVYWALVEGRVEPAEGVIDAPIARDRLHRKRMAVALAGRAARTRYKVIRYWRLESGAYTLVEAYPETGRTHQIRVHFAWLGHPLVGDAVYGRRKPSLPIARHFLHAARLTLRLPSTGEERTFTAPLPEELARVLNELDGLIVG
ncbi:MAG TPA: RluA family pseudouridine synthase [Anaerolineae bacterium]|nr:RluA family pseudouridine synthase [Anaerolineae bacterium]